MKISLIISPETSHTNFMVDKFRNILFDDSTDNYNNLFIYTIFWRGEFHYSENVKKSRLIKYENKISN